MEIIKAESAGFCFGVDNAVKTAFNTAENFKGQIYTYGPLIHNDAVISKLAEKGITVIDDIDKSVIDGACVVIRAHGVTPEIMKQLENSNCKIIDATCPFVSKIHKLVSEQYKDGKKIIIMGDESHPEVIGINGFCNNEAIIIQSVEEALQLSSLNKKSDSSVSENNDSYCVVAQTTFNNKKFLEIKNILKKLFDKIVIFDTICSATAYRQQETTKIAEQVDLMVVVGGRNSSNTKRLYEISKDSCSNVMLVENASELDVEKIKKFNRAGVTAGASTPDWIIEEVIGIMSDVNSMENNVVDAKEIEDQKDVSFESMLESSLTTIKSGEIVTGEINKIDSKGVYIDLGFKYEGFISIDEFAIPGFEPEQLNIGDSVEAMVVKVSDKDCEVILSKRRIDYRKNMLILEESYTNKTPIKVTITEAIKGGVIAFLGSVRIFIPASQLSLRFVKDITVFVGKSVDVVITAFVKGQKGRMKIVGSCKTILETSQNEKSDSFWSDMYVGKVCKGVVKSFTKFGAFVDIGGYDGLIHLTELSWRRIKHPSEILSIGQEIDVTVLACDREKNRISLGYRKSDDNPWFDAENLYQVGDILEVTVVRFVNFGVFVNIKDGIDGLVHISQISNQRIQSAADCLKIGQKVMAKIIDTNIAEKKINLSIKEVQAYNPEPKEGEEVQSEETVSNEEKSEVKAEKAPKKRTSKKAPKEAAEEAYVQEPVSSGSTIGDILASKFDNISEE